MPKSLLDVQDEFSEWQKNYGSDPRVAKTTLADYAKMADESAGTHGERSSAYEPHWYQSANALIDRGFRATHIPQLVGEGASGFAGLVGASPKVQEVARRVGEDLPRGLVESIATIPEAASGVGAPVAAATWANRVNQLRKILGYGGSALSGYAATESPLGGAISAGSLALGNKLLLPESLGGADVGGRVAATLRDRLGVGQTVAGEAGSDLAAQVPKISYNAPSLARTAAGVGGVGAELGTLSALNEATRQASLSVGPHALSINDEQRNPLTEENVAANVLGTVPFLPQLLKGVRGAAWDPRAVNGMKEWIENRKAAIEQTREDPTAEITQDATGEVKPTTRVPDTEPDASFSFETAMARPTPRWTPQERETLVKSAKSYIDAGAGWASEGHAEKSQAAYDAATRLLTESGLTKDDVAQMKDGATTFDNEARQMPPEDGPGMADFLHRFNSFVDYLNENRGKFEESLAGELPKSAEAQLRAATKPGETQSWRPEARSPEVVKRLQERGLLPKIDEAWLRNEFKYEVEDKGNTEFAKNVVVQKAVNRVLDQLPGALSKEKELPAVETPRAPTEDEARVAAAQKTLANRQSDFHDAIAEIGKTSDVAANEILKMSAEYFQRPILPDLTLRGKIVKGVPSSFVSNWIDIVTQAARTFDPVSMTIETRQGRQPISVLWRDEPSSGLKQLRPQLRALASAEGGRVRGKSLLPETSIEGMVRPENVRPEDEEAVLPGEAAVGSSTSAKGREILKDWSEEGTTPVEDVLPAEETPKAVRDQFLAPGETIRKSLESMTDAQVWEAVKSQYPQGRSSGMYEFRRNNARLLFQAAIEDAGKAKGDTIGPKSQELVNKYYEAGFGDVGQGRRALGVILNSMFQSHVRAPEAFLRRMGKLETSERNRNKYGWMMAGVDAILKKGPLKLEDVVPTDTAKPVPGEATGPQDLLVNHPVEGAFLGDVYRTLHDKFTEVLGSKGQGGTYRDLMVELGMSIARQAADPKNVDFYRIAAGPRGLAWDRASDTEGVGERGKVGLKVDTTPREREAMSENQWVNSVLYTFAHELAHIDDFIAHGVLPKPDAFSEERARVLRNIRSLGETLTPEQRNLVITSVEAGTRPPEHRPVGTDPDNRALRYGSEKPEEFTATLMGLVTQSLLFGKGGQMRTAMDVFDYSPTEVREFAQNTYRSIRDVAQALKETITNPEMKSADKVPDISRYVTGEAFDALVKSAEFASKVRDADIELSATREVIANMEGKIPVGPTASTWFKRQAEIGKYQPEVKESKSLENALEAIEEATEAIGLSYGKKQKNSAFVDWVFPFSNKMDFWRRKGIVMAEPLASLVFNVESNINLVRSAIFAPWMKKRPDGTVEWNSANPFEGLVAKRGNLRDAFNEVRRWQNENQGTATINGEQVPTREPMFVVDQQGVVQLNTNHSIDSTPIGVSGGKVQEAWTKISKGLSLEEQDALKAGSVAADQQTQLQWARTEGFVRDYAVYRVGQMLQRFNRKGLVEQIEPLAGRIVNEVMAGRGDTLRGVIPDLDLQNITSYLQGPMGDIQRIRTLAQTRPGHSTESLPGDHVIMYKDKEGKVKFTSAPSEYQAGYVMRKVEAQGNTLIGENPVHKSKLRGKFSDFDDPFDVLEKAAYHEMESWKGAVEAVRKTHGDAVADDLMQGYVPLSDSMKDVTSQGFRKFVDKSENKVDPENLDYLDALFARGSRFAASAVYHVTNAQKEFYLNDPRARMFPSLREAVDQQWQHMVSPTDLRFRQFRGLTAGYFMAGSISNAVMELTQGVTSFVPRIISSNAGGGVMKGYQDLFRAVGQVPAKFVNPDWAHLAAVAERKESIGGVLNGDETRAMMFKWAAERGVFGHNIIGEIFSSRDFGVQQKKLFGEGDYGPKSKRDMILNPLYVASQTLTGIYSWAAKLNDKIAFTMGVNQGIEQGLRGDVLFDHAKRFHQLGQGGGKTDAPGIVAKTAGADPMYRNAVGLMYTLQHYGTKMLASYVQMGAEAIGNSGALTPAQRVQARKAFLTFTATQLAMSGALGVPFVGAAMTLLEDEFGVPVKETVRKGLAALGSEDPDSIASGSAVTDVAMNGVVNQTLGIDAATRLGVSSLFGTSAYKGFALADLFGPAPSIVENMVKSLNYFGQGEPMQGARAMVPNAFKNAINVADSRQKYGTFALRDSGDDLLYKPTPAQTLLYQLGFQPRQSSNRRQAQQLLNEMNTRAQGESDRRVVDAARGLIGGDAGGAQRYAQELTYADPTVRRDDVLRRILQKATDLQVEKDLLATGPRGNEVERGQVMGTFPQGTNPRRSEMEMMGLKTQLAAQMGSPQLVPDRQEWTRAAVVDSLISQSGGTMARSQALALARLMGL